AARQPKKVEIGVGWSSIDQPRHEREEIRVTAGQAPADGDPGVRHRQRTAEERGQTGGKTGAGQGVGGHREEGESQDRITGCRGPSAQWTRISKSIGQSFPVTHTRRVAGSWAMPFSTASSKTGSGPRIPVRSRKDSTRPDAGLICTTKFVYQTLA